MKNAKKNNEKGKDNYRKLLYLNIGNFTLTYDEGKFVYFINHWQK